jgi:hypothetical protein
MANAYFTFLYNECKRLSNTPVDIQAIKDFINSPEGQKGYKAFLLMRPAAPKENPTKHVAQSLTGIKL